MNVEELLNKLDLFWQYPAITEKTFYEQEKNNPSYIGFPWATVIDKRINFNVILITILKYIIKNNIGVSLKYYRFIYFTYNYFNIIY